MMDGDIKLCINKVLFSFEKCFINNENELIIEPKNNIYFRLSDIKCKLDFDCKMIAWLSRPSCKGVSIRWQYKIRHGLNFYLNTNFDSEQMILIYTKLGNDINRKLCEKFVFSGFDLKILESEG